MKDTSAWADAHSVKAFISHMVQMKDDQSIKITMRKILYIPHGSDESSPPPFDSFPSWFFISHMVQMKGFFAAISIAFLILFISHMVQMKDTCAYLKIGKMSLYIPHGSDESNTYHSYKKPDISLYPTWFRWKGFGLWVQINRASLYIPHGSDERCRCCLFLYDLYAALYPTWFRWKEGI